MKRTIFCFMITMILFFSQNVFGFSFRGIEIGKSLKEQIPECKWNEYTKKYGWNEYDKWEKETNYNPDKEGICWSDKNSIDIGIPISNLPDLGFPAPSHAEEINGKVERIIVTFLEIYADKFLSILESKYGKPKLNTSKVQNRLGASFDKISATWKVENCTILFMNIYEDIDSGILFITSDTYIELQIKQKKQEIEDSASKL